MTKAHIWSHAYPPQLDWDFSPVSKPVHHIFEASALSYPEHPCLDFLGRKYTYKDVHQTVNRIASGLQLIGVKKGDRIGLCLPNTPYYVACYYAILKIGAIVVNFNPLYTEEEILEQVEDAGVKIMFTLGVKMIFDKVKAVQEKTQLETVVSCPLEDILTPTKAFFFKLFKGHTRAKLPENNYHYLSFEELTSHGEQVAYVSISPQDDPALFQYTGGTTGMPKGAKLSHSNVTSNTEQVRLWLESEHPAQHEKFLAVIPFFHVFAMTAAMNLAIRTGSELILLPRFDLKETFKTIHTKKPTIFPAVPSLFNAINNYNKIHRYTLTSIKYCISGGATLPREVKETFERVTNCTLVEGYGLSEASPVTHCNPPHSGGKVGAIGLPLPGTLMEIRSLDDVTETLPLGDVGEMVLRGPQVMMGYHNRQEDNFVTFTPDGWLRTGDVGYIDEDGYVFLTDRLKDIIISNGYNVYPKLIENAFYKHENVEEVTVIGVPHPYKGEVPKAFVKLKDGVQMRRHTLMRFVSAHLNPLERPREIEFREALPKTLIGKLSKKELAQEESEKRRIL